MQEIKAKTIIQRNKGSAWFGEDYNMNIYKGCSHGCIYCDSRSDCYRIDEFDRVRTKENALAIIRNDLQRKVRKGIIGTGSMSDPYNPHEEELRLTRNALELISAYEMGVSIATKSTLVTRDIDILSEIKEHSPVLVKITITTPSDELSKKIEPLAPSSSQRLAAIKQLADSGISCGILLMPVLPFVTDSVSDLTELLQKAAEAGAKFVYPGFGVTLRQNQREYYLNKLEEIFPGKGLKQQYIKRYGNDYQCTAPNIKQIAQSFKALCQEYGLLYSMKDIITSYKSPYPDTQLTFFNMD